MEHKRLFLTILAFLSYFTFASVTWAAEMKLLPSIGLQGEYNDNITFSRKAEKDDYIGTASPTLTLRYASELARLDSTVGADFKGYADENDLNTINQQYRMNGSYQATERYKLSGNFSFVKDTTLESELEETGLVLGREDRRRLTGGGGMTYRLDELSDIGVQYNYSDTNYDARNYIDYQSHTAALSYNHELKDRRNVVTVQSTYGYTTSDVSKVKNYGLSFGLAHAFTEKLRFNGSVGIRYTKTDFKLIRSRISIDPATGFLVLSFSRQSEEDEKWGGTANISLTGQGEVSSWNVGYTRDLAYSSYGEPIETQRLYGRTEWRLGDRLRAGITGSIYFAKSQGDIRDEDSRYYEVTPSVRYKITEDYSLQCAYSYSRDYDDRLVSDRTAERNRVWLMLVFRFKEI